MTTTFKPQPKASKSKKHHILVDLKPDIYEKVRVAAATGGVSMKEFMRQATNFALDSLEKS